MNSRRAWQLSGLTFTLLNTSLAVYAQAPFPSRAVRLIAASVPGGAVDTVARVVSARLNDALGQPVVVENRAGASGAIAAEITAKAAPDGYTIMIGGNANLTLNPLMNKLSYHPLRDFAPITTAALGGHILVVHPTLPVKTVSEFVALAKARPGQLSYGTAGPTSSQHLTAVLLQRVTGIQLLHVPYKGGPSATADLVAGQTQLGFPSTASAMAFVNQGRLRALAVTTRQRSRVFTQLPTMAEVGLPDVVAYTWYGFVVAAKTPQSVVERLNRDIVQILKQSESVELLGRVGMEVWTGAPEAFATHLKAEYDKWGRILRESGITG